jgi:hypothetical protein
VLTLVYPIRLTKASRPHGSRRTASRPPWATYPSAATSSPTPATTRSASACTATSSAIVGADRAWRIRGRPDEPLHRGLGQQCSTAGDGSLGRPHRRGAAAASRSNPPSVTAQASEQEAILSVLEQPVPAGRPPTQGRSVRLFSGLAEPNPFAGHWLANIAYATFVTVKFCHSQRACRGPRSCRPIRRFDVRQPGANCPPTRSLASPLSAGQRTQQAGSAPPALHPRTPVPLPPGTPACPLHAAVREHKTLCGHPTGRKVACPARSPADCGYDPAVSVAHRGGRADRSQARHAGSIRITCARRADRHHTGMAAVDYRHVARGQARPGPAMDLAASLDRLPLLIGEPDSRAAR